MLPTLWLHEVDNQFIDKMILDVFKRIMDNYLEQKSLIPPENLMELRFEDFEKHPIEELEKIFTQLLEEDFASVKKYFSDYFNSQKDYKKNEYTVDATLVNMIREEWTKYFEIYKYELPAEMIIEKNT